MEARATDAPTPPLPFLGTGIAGAGQEQAPALGGGGGYGCGGGCAMASLLKVSEEEAHALVAEVNCALATGDRISISVTNGSARPRRPS